jgi:hypothetical protein
MIMGYVKAGEVFVKMPVPIELRDDLKMLALLDGMTLKEKIWKLYRAEVNARADELKELKERRQKRNSEAK